MSADATHAYAAMEPRRRRRLLLRTLLRAVVTPIVLLVLYYTLPLDNPLKVGKAGWFVLGFVLFAAAVAWQVYSITHSEHPHLRQIEAVMVLVPVFLLLFSGAYFVLEDGHPGSFTQPLSRTDALYFTITVFATVGFGDITAKTTTARVLVMIQMLGGLAVVGVIAKLLVGAVQIGVQRMSGGGSEGGPGGGPGKDP
ncbi:potassium channel family protein [Actinacidiphila acidipaludis]|uniref:Potassium channel family protein n=1 Tax=Actinacidiphila acidipaludis TaxID=2873382 RepID=A0ABS7Q5I4_9ACTN|nr:potassium channel family protein [Streptomyces acidipaludis]MBY8877984.1 potassium channel family protein [Streptomyces acidipaludis]